MNALRVRALVCVVLGAGLASGVQAADPPRRLIAVSGEGEVEAAADLISLSLTITTDGEELLVARGANDKRATAIAKVAVDQGVKAEHLQTANFDIAAQFDKEQGSMRYRVVRTVVISVHDIPKFEGVLAALIKQGGFKINSIKLEHSRLAEHQAEARKRAYADARRKAAQLAELDGVKLGKAWRIVVDDADEKQTPFVTSVIPVVGDGGTTRAGSSTPAFQVAPEKPAAKGDAAKEGTADGAILSPGRITVGSSVTIQFEAE